MNPYIAMTLIYRTCFVLPNHTGTKGIGEACGGPYGSNGRCIEGLKCTAKERKFLAGEDISGICLGESQHKNALKS